MNRRTAKVVQLHQSLAVVLPRDWTRGMEIAKGDFVELTYNGTVHIRPKRGDE
jgi:antitoxin component of MazEF toxin-antitoxin module